MIIEIVKKFTFREIATIVLDCVMAIFTVVILVSLIVMDRWELAEYLTSCKVFIVTVLVYHLGIFAFETLIRFLDKFLEIMNEIKEIVEDTETVSKIITKQGEDSAGREE